MLVRLRRRSVVAYLVVAGVVATGRIACFLYIDHRIRSHTVTEFVYNLMALLEPEALLFLKASLELGQPKSPVLVQLLFALALGLGSFLWTLPILFVGSSRTPRRDG
ncbi:MAG: hypothetical protein L0312_24565 [Acidobacteria bacterium]|nr:hypothetical protein [Acidobacteriota bacterium]